MRTLTDALAWAVQERADQAQDRLCAADRNHAWGPWVRYAIQPDVPNFLAPDELPPKFAYRTESRRTCENCGKREVSAE